MFMGLILFFGISLQDSYLELSSEIPAQDFNLFVNIDNFFPVFLLIIIGNSFQLFKFTLYLKNCLIGITWELSSKWCQNYLYGFDTHLRDIFRVFDY